MAPVILGELEACHVFAVLLCLVPPQQMTTRTP
jgi:hypothetical protein